MAVAVATTEVLLAELKVLAKVADVDRDPERDGHGNCRGSEGTGNGDQSFGWCCGDRGYCRGGVCDCWPQKLPATATTIVAKTARVMVAVLNCQQLLPRLSRQWPKS